MSDKTSGAPAGRRAVAGLFFLNGYVIGNWVPKIPEIGQRLQITEFEIGLILFAFGCGAVAGLPVAGIVISNHGSRTLSLAGAFLSSFVLLALSLVPSHGSAVVTGFGFGLFLGGMDVAMNANAVSVERLLRRPIMSSSHGFWSLGGLTGSATGGWLIANIGPVGQALLVAVVGLVLTAWAFTALLDDSESVRRDSGTRFRLPREGLAYLVGLVALMSMVPEGAVLDWSALFLIQERGAELAISGFGFAAFSMAMAMMRFFGDGLRARYGAVVVFRVSAALAGGGMLAAALMPIPWLVIAGFCLSGFGIANLVPITLSAAGNLPGVSAGRGLGIVTTLAYSGFIFFPTIIGFVAEHTGFAPVYVVMSATLVILVALGSVVRHAEPDRQ